MHKKTKNFLTCTIEFSILSQLRLNRLFNPYLSASHKQIKKDDHVKKVIYADLNKKLTSSSAHKIS